MSVKEKKALVAMSGGVDSSVAAYLMKEQGYEVIGVSMHLVSCHRSTGKSCCSASDRSDARDVCTTLGIPHYTLDYRREFQQKVIQPFIASYARGRTPIPCTSCNAELKFSAFFEDMRARDAKVIATGHYARVSLDRSGAYRLFRGSGDAEDQSYYLFQLTQDELKHLAFPLGDLTKQDVRRIAREQGFITQDKPESQEICFVPDDDYVAFVEQNAAHLIHGEINFIDLQGNILGKHAGIHAYTVGQRRGLGISRGERMFVVEIRAQQNEVVLGTKSNVMRREMEVRGLHWVCWQKEKQMGEEQYFERPVHVRIRSQHPPAKAFITPTGERSISVRFEDPQCAITPGQAAVIYDGDEVLGGGWIQ